MSTDDLARFPTLPSPVSKTQCFYDSHKDDRYRATDGVPQKSLYFLFTELQSYILSASFSPSQDIQACFY